MSNYFDQRIESIEPVIDYDDNGKPCLCAEIHTNYKDQTGNPVTIHLTKAELRKVLEQLEAL
jgi:hypothetical protein